jgi:hypothetical protein
MTGAGMGHATYIKGVPHPLPAGEHLLWEGAPDARAMAVHVFHRRLVAAYFGAMLLWWAVATTEPVTSPVFVSGLALRVLLTLVVLGIAEGLARASARTSWYAITNRRVVLRLGVVLPMSINIPFSIIDGARIGTFGDGTGQLVLTLGKAHRLAYIALWPHCQVFRFTHPEPVLRGLRDPKAISALLVNAVAAAGETDVQITPATMAPPGPASTSPAAVGSVSSGVA